MLPGNVKRVHFIGIGGYGMSALAMILLQMGYEVSGSDLKSSRLTDRLKDKGAEIIFHHEADNIENCDLVVYSTAIQPIIPNCWKPGAPVANLASSGPSGGIGQQQLWHYSGRNTWQNHNHLDAGAAA